MTPHEITLVVYNLTLLPVVFFSALFFMLSVLNLFVDKPVKVKKSSYQPSVTVQIPSYNDPIAAKCIEACLQFTYKNYDILILDDSTDKKTAKLLKSYAKHPNVTYIHRENRRGYKPGALQDAMPHVKGDIIVIFDADFVPQKDFLERIVTPFKDEKVAIVQGRQGFINKDFNLISRFAAYTLMIYHTIVMPINNKANTVMFCGTAGAIRKSALMAVGGWNAKSVTEDSDLSVKILSKGYKSVYMPFETPSEVPVTLEVFLKQQMRWCYGMIRVWIDHMGEILYKRGLTIRQRLMITYITLGNLIAPVVVIMTIAGFSGWFVGDPQLMTMSELSKFVITIFYTAGFLVMGAVALYKYRSLKEFPHMLLSTFAISMILAVANTVAIFKAVFMKDKPLFAKQNNSWICTQKQGNVLYK